MLGYLFILLGPCWCTTVASMWMLTTLSLYILHPKSLFSYYKSKFQPPQLSHQLIKFLLVMAINSLMLLPFYVGILVLSHRSMAQLFGPSINPWQASRQGGFRECNFNNLQTFEPVRKMRSEAGTTEYFDVSNEQFRCTGVFAIRRVIEPQGLVLPRYTNTPGLVYIIQGSGTAGLALPGCPETYQRQFRRYGDTEFAEGQRQSRKFRDENQKIHRFRQGDVFALPAGVTHWFHNDGDTPVVAVYVFDINNNANQLGPRQKEFLLAGNKREQQRPKHVFEQQIGHNILNEFNVEFLIEAFGISTELAQKLRSQNDQRGEIVRVHHGLQLVQPSTKQQEEDQERQTTQTYQEGMSRGIQQNGLEENFCVLEPRINIEDPNRADIYNPRAGRITRLNSQKLPILNTVQMSATRVNLYQNALLAPSWNINAHSVVYMIQGQARVQVVNNHGKTVFNGIARRGQLLIIPQNYVVVKKAEPQGCQYIAFKTNGNSMVSHITGKNSIFHALPVDVIANAYSISREEARSLKNNRAQDIGAFTPWYPHKSYQIKKNEDESSSAEEFSE